MLFASESSQKHSSGPFLNPEWNCPVLLTKQEWRSLKRSVHILAKGSASSHNSKYGATDEGYTQVVGILEYTAPDNICTTTAVIVVGGD